METLNKAKGLKYLLTAVAMLGCSMAVAQVLPALPSLPVQPDNAPYRPPATDTTPRPETSAPPSFAVPLAEIAGFDFLLNRYNHAFSGIPDYDVSFSTFRRNLHRSWGVDKDPFNVNQLGHPYQGSMYMGFARSANLDFWPALGVTFLGSIGWELAGENTRPSRNDQVASGVGGAFLGEALYRMANLMLENGGTTPRLWREVGAAVISPSNAFNRHVYGHGYGSVYSSRGAAYYSRAQFGLMGATQNRQGLSFANQKYDAQADFLLEFGLPGQDDYTYRQPFDYFSFQATASSANVFENVLTRGLLWGGTYNAAHGTYRGIYGLYGSYDYLSPQTFRISTTALSLGTTAEWKPNDEYVVQGTGTLGVGYSAVSSLNSSVPDDYRYGVTPQALLALRLIRSNVYAIDLAAREYFVANAGTNLGPGGHDNISRAEAAFTYRVRGPHAVSVKYLWNRRDATSTVLGDRTQIRSTVGLFYTLLGADRFGAVDWKR